MRVRCAGARKRRWDRLCRCASLSWGILVLAACTTQPTPASQSAVTATPGTTVTATQSVVEITAEPDAYIGRLAECLREAGWNVQVDSQGGLSAHISADQRAAFMAARETCTAKAGPPPTSAPVSEADIRLRYDYLVRARECLLALGFALREPPSFEQFLDDYATGPWTPYLELADQTNQSEWERANAACPQTPDS
jgi:hypothetical protein